MTLSGEMVLAPRYLEIRNTNHGDDTWPLPARSLYSSSPRGGWGFVAQSGSWIVEPGYASVEPYQNGIGQVYNGEKWSAVDESGELIDGVVVDELGRPAEDVIPARIGTQWGAYSTSGEVLIPFEYEYVGEFRYGVAAARKNGQWGYIDTQNSIVVPFEHSGTARPIGPNRFSVLVGGSLQIEIVEHGDAPRTQVFQELQPALRPDIRYDVIDRTGTVVWSTEDVRASHPDLGDDSQIFLGSPGGQGSSSRAIVVSGGRRLPDSYQYSSVLLDHDGNELLQGVFNAIHLSDEGGYALGTQYPPLTITRFDQDFSVLETVELAGFPPVDGFEPSPEWLGSPARTLFDNAIEFWYDDPSREYPAQQMTSIVSIDDGAVLEPPTSPQNGASVDENPFVRPIDMVPSLYRFTADYEEPIVDVVLNGRFGGGSQTVRARFDQSVEPDYPENRYPLVIEDAESGIVSDVPETVRGIWEFHDGIAAFSNGDRRGFIDTNGDIVIEAQYDEVSDMINGSAGAALDGRWGIIDRNGEWIVPPTFAYAMPFMGDLAPVWNGDKWGYVDRTGKVVIDFRFEYAEPFRDGWAVVADEVVSVRWNGPDKSGHPTFLVAGDWYLISADGSRIPGISGDTIWRLFADEMIVQIDDQYFLARLSDSARVEIDRDDVENYVWSAFERPRHFFQ